MNGEIDRVDADLRALGGLPTLEKSLVVRTSFDDPDAWEGVLASLSRRRGMFPPHFAYVDDPANAGLTAEEVVALSDPEEDFHVYLADEATLAGEEMPLLLVALYAEESGRTVRVAADAFWEVDSNLSIANIGMDDLENDLPADGIYRGVVDAEALTGKLETLPTEALVAATVASAENLLGRPLTAEENSCIAVDTSSGFPSASIGSPLAERLEAASGGSGGASP